MSALVDTNLLVYRFDARDARKQQLTEALLREGIQQGSLRLPQQAIVEVCCSVYPPAPWRSSVVSAGRSA